MSEVQIRRARLDDLPAIQELIRSSFQALVDFYPALAASFAGPALDHMLSDLNADQFDSVYCVNGSAFWVAVDSSLKLIGSVALKCNKHPHEGELVRMAVAPGLRGGGIGRKLVAELEAHCHAHGILRVQAVTANPLSAKFYQDKCDFSVVSEFTRSPDAQTIVKVLHLIKYLGERVVRRVAIVGGTHGNERIGVELVRQWNQQPSLVSRSSFEAVHCMIGNPRAVSANVRFIDADLNRQFAVTDEVKDTAQYEVGRAAELREWFQQQRIDFVIDLHSSNSNVGQVIMMADAENDVTATRLVHSLVAEFGADTLRVANFEGTKKQAWSLDAVAPAGLSVEIGPLPHGTVTSTLLESSRRLVMRALDLLHQRNEQLLKFSVPTNPFACDDIIPVAAAPSLIRMPDHRPQLPVFVSRSIVKFPAADDESSVNHPLLAVVAPALEGCNFQPLNHGDAAFVAADGSGTVWPLVDPRPEGKRDGPLYTLFVNESAYQSKRIAFIAYERKEIFVF